MNEQLESYRTAYDRMLNNSASSFGSIALQLWDDYLNEREKDDKRGIQEGNMEPHAGE